jgi:predicted acylesterase/phospholipase RssA
LAFSGGAAFGAYQVGAWLELQAENWRPDVVSGISIGGVNAYLVAHGATGEEMLKVWREWPAELLPNRVRRFAPPWAAQGPMFVAWLQRVVAEFGTRPLTTRLRLVGLEALTLRQTVFEDEAVDGAVLLAGCSLPGVLPPTRVNGRLCIDCGLLRYVPLRECLSLGVDELIAVDLLKKHPFPLARWAREWLLDGLDYLRGEHSEPAPSDLARIRYTEIGHDTVLGSIRESFQWRLDAADRMIELGRQDARVCLGRHAKKAAPMQISHPDPVSAAPQ